MKTLPPKVRSVLPYFRSDREASRVRIPLSGPLRSLNLEDLDSRVNAVKIALAHTPDILGETVRLVSPKIGEYGLPIALNVPISNRRANLKGYLERVLFPLYKGYELPAGALLVTASNWGDAPFYSVSKELVRRRNLNLTGAVRESHEQSLGAAYSVLDACLKKTK